MKKILFYFLVILHCFGYSQTCSLFSLAEDLVGATEEFKTILNTNDGFKAYEILAIEASGLKTSIDELSLVSKNLLAIEKAGGYIDWKLANAGGDVLSFADKSKLFVKNENALLSYARSDGTFFMQKSPSYQGLTTGLSDELTLSFKYKSGPNANSKDIFGTVALSDDGYIVANLKKPKGMTNQQIKGVTDDALDMTLHHYGKNNVKGIKSTWVKNKDLYPDLPDNKSFNLTKFEDAMKSMSKSDAAFETITGRYAKSRGFNKVKEVKEVKEFTESKDGFYGYEVIYGL